MLIRVLKVIEILNEYSDVLPQSPFRENLKPFWNNDLDKFKSEKVVACRQWVKRGRPRSITDKWSISYKRTKTSFSANIQE